MRAHTTTPAINRGNWWYSAARSECATRFLNGVQRTVNRKVQGSNPCPGAKPELESAVSARAAKERAAFR